MVESWSQYSPLIGPDDEYCGQVSCDWLIFYYSPLIGPQVMQDYFKEVEEESVRDNFVICYELLDEMVDFGYPQTTDAKILQEYITQVRIEDNRILIYWG